MTREISITVTVPIDCTEEQFEEWVYAELGYRGGVSLENPLCEYDLEAEQVSIY